MSDLLSLSIIKLRLKLSLMFSSISKLRFEIVTVHYSSFIFHVFFSTSSLLHKSVQTLLYGKIAHVFANLWIFNENQKHDSFFRQSDGDTRSIVTRARTSVHRSGRSRSNGEKRPRLRESNSININLRSTEGHWNRPCSLLRVRPKK